MSNDERPDSLAAQAAAWVPPWERQQREPDRAYQAAAEDEARRAEEEAEDEARQAEEDAEDEVRLVQQQAEDELGLAGQDAGDEPIVEAAEGDVPAGEPAGVDSAALPEQPVSVDAPRADEPEREPTDVRSGPELPLPGAVEDAADEAVEDESGAPVDAPLPPDGDDAGDVFDAAADDDVSDGAEVDLPFAAEASVFEEIPTAEDDSTVGASRAAEDDSAVGASRAAEGDSAVGASRTAGDDSTEAWSDAEAPWSGEAGPVAGAAPVAEPASGAGAGLAGELGGDAVGGRAAVPAQGRGVRNGQGAVEDASDRTEMGVDLPALMDDGEFTAALEAILLVVDEPVAEMQLAQILEQPTERVAAALEDISARYTAAGHGFDLRRAAGGWRLYTRPEYAAYVERFVLDGQSVRLTQAALETLAVVAYKQPVTRSRISAIRGVNCDGVMRTLVTRGLIEECGTEGETGAYLYRTTALFLEKLGLNSVDQLPPLAPFLPDDVEEVLDASG